MSGLSQQDLPEVVVATSGRSSCQTCGESIGKGENRVGMVGRSSGVSCMKWMHPQCFALNMRIEYAPTGRARCNTDRDGALIGKGEPRLLMRMMKTSCGGEVVAKAQQIYKPANAAALLTRYLSVEGVSVTAATIGGLDELEAEHRQWAVDALEGRDISSREVPVGTPATKPRAAAARSGGDAEAGGSEAAALPKPAAKSAAKPEGKPAGKRAKKAAGAPKGVASGYMLWCKEERQAAEYAPLSFGEAGKALGAKWRSLSDEAKAPWVEASKRDRARHAREMVAFAPAPGIPSAEAAQPPTKKEEDDDDDEEDAPLSKRRRQGKASQTAAAPPPLPQKDEEDDDEEDDDEEEVEVIE